MIYTILFIQSYYLYQNNKRKLEIYNSLKEQDESLENTKIDLVYTWVDGKNLEWNKIKNRYLEKKNNINHDNSDIRYSSNMEPSFELTLSIKSVLKYMNWINKIFIVVYRPFIPDIPKDIDTNKIKFIFHDEIINQEYLPVFNSHAIEANIHKIPGLQEQFIYMNDDFYISNYISKDNFFTKDLKPIARIYGQIILNIKKKFPKKDESVLNLVYKNLSNRIGISNIGKCIHHAYPLTKSLMLNTEKEYFDLFELTSKSRFRSSTDIPPINTCINYGLLTNQVKRGFVIQRNFRHVFISENTLQIEKQLYYFINKFIPFHMICVNSHEDKWDKIEDFIFRV